MRFQINKNLLVRLVAGFFIATVVGTLSHEAGHCLAAAPYAAPGSIQISYESMTWDDKDSLYDQIEVLDTVQVKTPEEQQRYEALWKRYISRKTQVRLGGPLITIITGILGLLLSIIFIRPGASSLSAGQWVMVYLSFFWLRPVYIFLFWILEFFPGRRSYCDETVAAELLHVHNWVTILPGGLIGITACTWIFFKRIPAMQRQTFALAMIIGCPLAYICWFYLIGPVVLP